MLGRQMLSQAMFKAFGNHEDGKAKIVFRIVTLGFGVNGVLCTVSLFCNKLTTSLLHLYSYFSKYLVNGCHCYL